MKRRLPAEWEPQTAIHFTFPHKESDWANHLDKVIPCFVEIIETVCQFENVVVVCKDIALTKQLLKNCPTERLQLIQFESNDTWARDHSGITIFENGESVILDFMFNGWGLKFPADKDNLITQKLFNKGVFTAKKLQKIGLVLEGGGIESDGKGTLLTTTECLLSPNRNPHLSKKQIENRLIKLFGLHRILWLNHGLLEGDDTDSHIDTLARFCDENTIAYIQCNDQTDSHFHALNLMEQELKSFKTKDDAPYRLIPLPMASPCFDEEGNRLPATYANFLIINQAVLVPIYGVPQDATALKILETCFPNRKIIGINCSPLILQHGSLHCITMQHY